MSALTIHLLGRPEIERDGAFVEAPRGRKAWAVLAYLALSPQRVSRATLARLIFADASDPLGALRWTLAQLRQALGAPELLLGDPLDLELPVGFEIDVVLLAAGEPRPELVRGELLEGVDLEAGPVFDAWLLVERRRAASVCEAVLRDAALEALAVGRGIDAAALATRALAFDPFDESSHELLVRCLAGAGQIGAARHHASACEVLFRRELGREPDPRVRRAAEDGQGGRVPTGDRAAALGQLAAGRAALDAGAVEPGLACLRQATAEARAVGDPALLAKVLAALGTALVHTVRGRDEEGAAILHEALALADANGLRAQAVKLSRELGFVEVQAGRAATAGRWLIKAHGMADGDSERAGVLAVRGMALSDRAHYAAAAGLLEESIALARGAGDLRQAAWSLAILGRVHVLRDQLAEAAPILDQALALVEQEGWLAFQPFPEALRAEVALRQRDPDRAATLLDHAFSLGCRLGDPCWEAMAARARGLVLEAIGDRRAALACLRDAVARAGRVADPYVWIQAYALDALVAVEIADAAPNAHEHLTQLEQLAARGDLRELVVRGALHRARLGDPDGHATARVLAEGIDNPTLHAAIDSARP